MEERCKSWFESIDFLDNKEHLKDDIDINTDNCLKYIPEITDQILDTNIDLTNIYFPNSFNDLKDKIKKLVNDNWDNPVLNKRCTYNSDNNDNDLFTNEQLTNRVYKRRHQINDIPDNLYNILDTDLPIPDIPYNPGRETSYGLNNTNAKKNLQQIATDFNTIHLIGSKLTRLRFIKLIIETFTIFYQEIYTKHDNLNENNLNITLKGGIPLRFVMKELIRNFSTNIENYIYHNIKKIIKFSDYDFEMISNRNITLSTKIKINTLSYIVVLLIKDYLINNYSFFFDFFEYTVEKKSVILEILKENLQTRINEMDGNPDNNTDPEDTIALKDGTHIHNFYKNSIIHYVEMKDLYTNELIYNSVDYTIGDSIIYQDHLALIVSIKDVNLGNLVNLQDRRDLTREEIRKHIINMKTEDKIYDINIDGRIIHDVPHIELKPNLENYDNNDNNDGNDYSNDIALIIDGTRDEGNLKMIKTKKLLEIYDLHEYIQYCNDVEDDKITNFYTSHNPLITNYKDPNSKDYISFQLNRIKCNYIIYFTKEYSDGNIGYYKSKISGEVLDLSSKYNQNVRNDILTTSFNDNRYLSIYKFNTVSLSFYSYSLYGFIKDLHFMIFTFTNYIPWTGNEKYKKRIERLLYLTILYSFTECYPGDFKHKIKYIHYLHHIINNNSYNIWYVRKLDIYKILLDNLQKVYMINVVENGNIMSRDFVEFKNFILHTLKTVINIFTSQYISSLNFNLTYKPINSDSLFISDTSLYKY